jgi:hypothetical protein
MPLICTSTVRGMTWMLCPHTAVSQFLAREYPPGAAQKELQELVLDPTEVDAALPAITATGTCAMPVVC